jgi:hypothetical protein
MLETSCKEDTPQVLVPNLAEGTFAVYVLNARVSEGVTGGFI